MKSLECAQGKQVGVFFVLFFVLFLVTGSYAAESTNENQNDAQSANQSLPTPPAGGKGRVPLAPPQAIVDACVGKSEGSACQLQGTNGNSISGICVYTPDKKYFTCRPNTQELSDVNLSDKAQR
ncbi:MAG: hypothetical protein WCY05_07830 [Candidatus Omnitrophota bacterium]